MLCKGFGRHRRKGMPAATLLKPLQSVRGPGSWVLDAMFMNG
jgi:hypothetical protein